MQSVNTAPDRRRVLNDAPHDTDGDGGTLLWGTYRRECFECRVAESQRSREYYYRTRRVLCHGCGADRPVGRTGQRLCDDCKTPGAKRWTPAHCRGCGGAFTPTYRGPNGYVADHCSRACIYAKCAPGKSHEARARKYGGKVEHVDRLTVFDRDGWLCQLCDLPVDRALRWPDPGSVSLDHVVPLSRGGDHVYANVWTAHLSCNIAKHNIR